MPLIVTAARATASETASSMLVAEDPVSSIVFSTIQSPSQNDDAARVVAQRRRPRKRFAVNCRYVARGFRVSANSLPEASGLLHVGAASRATYAWQISNAPGVLSHGEHRPAQPNAVITTRSKLP